MPACLSSTSSLKSRMKKNKKFSIRRSLFECDGCKRRFSHICSLKTHQNTCLLMEIFILRAKLSEEQAKLSEREAKLAERNEEMKKLEHKHNNLLLKRMYHTFKKGPVFYIISDTDSRSDKFKVGIEGKDVNVRLAQHRSTTPGIKLEFLIYTGKCGLIEKMMLEKYKNNRDRYNNHEWIFGIDVSVLVNDVKVLTQIIEIEYTEETDLSIYNEQV